MRRKHFRFGAGFRVAVTTGNAQAAEMVIPPGGAEGGADNRHRGADQWLFVVAGRGTARINEKRYPLLDRGRARRSTRDPLRTLNLYLPPAYTSAGDKLPAAKP